MSHPYASLTLVACLLAVGADGAADTATSYPAHTIDHSQLRELPRNAAGRHYQLHIGLPASYDSESTKRYPVVYVTDAYWDFQKITAIGGALVYDRVVPEFITVGLGYVGQDLNYGELRRWELSPAPLDNDPAATGHAAEFLQTIKSEIIPFVEREYRVDSSHRVLAGASLGGLFTLYALFTEPELFHAYIAATPAVVVGNDWLLQYEDAFARSGRSLPVRLYVTGGSYEWPSFLAGIHRFNDRIKQRSYPKLKYAFRLIEEERHAGMQMESYTRGLRFAFEPLAPETGPASDR